MLPEHPRTLYQKGSLNAKSLIGGGTSRDGVAGWYAGLPRSAEEYHPAVVAHWTDRIIRTLTGFNLTGLGERVYQMYPLNRYRGHWGAAYVAADGDYNVLCPTKMLLHDAEKAGVIGYQYHFSHGPRCGRKPMNHRGVPNVTDWAWHCAEELFLFGGYQG